MRDTPTPPPLRGSMRGAPMFAELPDEMLEGLAHISHRRSIARGEALFRVGDPARETVLVCSGLVKVLQDEANSSTIIGIFGPRAAVGLMAVVQGRPHRSTALALTARLDVISTPSTEFLQAMEHNSRFAVAVNQALAAKASVLRSTIDIISAGSVARRLATLFLNLAERFGDEIEDGTTIVPIVLSRGELASLVCVRVETVIRILSEWAKAGLIRTTDSGFILYDSSALRRINHP